MAFNQNERPEVEQPGAYPWMNPGGLSGSATYFVVQREGDGSLKISLCLGEQEAEKMVETLLTEGVAVEAIDLYQGSKSQFNVAYKPVVKLNR